MNADQKPARGFDHEKLDVYQLELRFIVWVTPLLEEALRTATGKAREVCDQLDRASLSALLNTAEGNGRRQRQTRAKFFDDARGSATESAACLDALVAKQVVTPERIREGKGHLVRIVSMLCGLVDRFDTGSRLQEEPMEYQTLTDREDGGHAAHGLCARTTTTRRTRRRTRTSGSAEGRV
jgi:four helix bundle protein